MRTRSWSNLFAGRRRLSFAAGMLLLAIIAAVFAMCGSGDGKPILGVGSYRLGWAGFKGMHIGHSVLFSPDGKIMQVGRRWGPILIVREPTEK